MAPPCSPTTQKSDFFKITVICFVCIAIIHQWSLAEIATSTINRTAHTSPGRKLAGNKTQLSPNLKSVVKETAHASSGTNLPGQSQNTNLKPDVKIAANIPAGTNLPGKSQNTNLKPDVKIAANIPAGINLPGKSQNTNLKPDVKIEANIPAGINLPGKSQNTNLKPDVKIAANIPSGVNLAGKSQNTNLKSDDKITANISLGTNQSGKIPNANLTSVVIRKGNTSLVPNISGINPKPDLFGPIISNALCKDCNGDKAKGPKVAEQWTESTKVPITERRYVASENNRVFILGVVAKNSTPSAKWDKFAVYGQWYDHKYVNESNVRCCFQYADGTITEHRNSEFDPRNYKPGMLWAKLMLFHITCDSPPSAPRWVSIARHYSCDSGNVTFIKPYFAMKKPAGHIVITTKMAYRYVNPETVAGFLETARYLGVGKVVTYVMDSLEPDLKKIMRYYAHIGILDYYTIELAQRELVFRRFPPVVNAQYRCDEWIVKRDALERNMGSTYFGIFDMDEYLVPSRDRSFKQLLSDLLVRFSNASHFFFPNVHYLTDSDFEDPVCAPDCSMFRRHIMTSPDRFNSIHEKMMLVTSRVVTSTVTNHRIQPMPGFARVTCPDSEAYIRHYGKCFRKFTKPICGNSSLWIKDTTMVSWAERTIHDNIQKARKILKVF